MVSCFKESYESPTLKFSLGKQIEQSKSLEIRTFFPGDKIFRYYLQVFVAFMRHCDECLGEPYFILRFYNVRLGVNDIKATIFFTYTVSQRIKPIEWILLITDSNIAGKTVTRGGSRNCC